MNKKLKSELARSMNTIMTVNDTYEDLKEILQIRRALWLTQLEELLEHTRGVESDDIQALRTRVLAQYVSDYQRVYKNERL